MISISVIIPVYGSSGILPKLHQRLSAVMQALEKPYEIIFIDDCSKDNSWDVLRTIADGDPSVKAIQLMKNSGQSNATLCGLSHSSGELVITMDDDLQHPPEEIPVMYNALTSEIDVLIGVAAIKHHGWYRRLGSYILDRINSFQLGKKKDLRFTSFRIIRRSVVEGLLQIRTIQPALGPMINSLTDRVANVSVKHAPRKEGVSGYTLSKLFQQATNNLIGYSIFPLRFLAIIGVLCIIFSIVYALVLLVSHNTHQSGTPAWTLTMLLMIFLSGINFLAFYLLAEHLLRILKRVNSTPQFILRQQYPKER